MRGCFEAVVFPTLRVSEGSSVQGEGGPVAQPRLMPSGVWTPNWVVSLLGPVCDEGDITASMCLGVAPIRSLPLWFVLRILRV